MEKFKRGERIKRFETVHVGKDGRRIDVSMTISPVKDAHEQIIGAAAITPDVSDRELLEKQLQQAQKMEKRWKRSVNSRVGSLTISTTC